MFYFVTLYLHRQSTKLESLSCFMSLLNSALLKSKEEVRCYLCDEIGHLQRNCPTCKPNKEQNFGRQKPKKRGITCFYCKKEGHIRAKCPKLIREGVRKNVYKVNE